MYISHICTTTTILICAQTVGGFFFPGKKKRRTHGNEIDMKNKLFCANSTQFGRFFNKDSATCSGGTHKSVWSRKLEGSTATRGRGVGCGVLGWHTKKKKKRWEGSCFSGGCVYSVCVEEHDKKGGKNWRKRCWRCTQTGIERQRVTETRDRDREHGARENKSTQTEKHRTGSFFARKKVSVLKKCPGGFGSWSSDWVSRRDTSLGTSQTVSVWMM